MYIELQRDSGNLNLEMKQEEERLWSVGGAVALAVGDIVEEIEICVTFSVE
jgi:hypothetical protein